jgi:hypothetical protein
MIILFSIMLKHRLTARFFRLAHSNSTWRPWEQLLDKSIDLIILKMVDPAERFIRLEHGRTSIVIAPVLFLMLIGSLIIKTADPRLRHYHLMIPVCSLLGNSRF